MSKIGKNLMLIILCAALALSVFALPVRLSSSQDFLTPAAADEPAAGEVPTQELPSQQNTAYKGFIEKTNAIYRQYDQSVDSESYDNPYALRRIMVTDFNGDTYGACDYAYDSENDFAVLQYPTEAAAEQALTTMLADGVTAEPDTIAVMDAAGKCTFDAVAGEQLGLPAFFDHYQIASDSVLVAVLDTGIMYDHKAIADRFYSHGVDLSGDGKKDAYYDTEQSSSLYSHGTFIAGILADNTPDSVKIQPYKIVSFNNSFAPSSAIVTGINTAVLDGVSVINISSHTNGGAAAIERAVKNANNKGVCVCASAGNKNEVVANAYPACTPGVITVTATDGSALADFSSFGDVVDFAAPGKNIRSTYAGEGGRLMSRWNGTSFSTPYIAAMCANAKSMNKKMTRNEVYDMLTHCADDYGDAGYDIYFGYGVPNFEEIHYEGDGYAYDLPQGTMTVTGGQDYTVQNRPWYRFTQKMRHVTVADAVSTIGKYAFYNMASADFTLPQSLESVGDYAFYNCDKLNAYAFDETVETIGYKAFGDIEDFSLSGYRNTPAETYAITEGIPFTVLGCKHNYIFEVFDPTETEEGYTEYTCTVCGNSYQGAYIPPVVLASGQCGDALTYVLYDNGKLVLDGSGAMDDYFEKEAPWYAYRDQLQILEIRKDVSSIDAFAFFGCDKLSKIRCYSANAAMYSDGISLIDSQTHALILTAAQGKYTIPEDVTSISAPALITLGNSAVEPNSHFTMQDGILYDADGSLICALPSYAAETFKIDNNTTIKQYAFMYTQYPKKLDTNLLHVGFEPFSIGYYYDGTLKKTDLSVKAFAESTAYQYADENGFEVDGADIGKCGEDITWRYDATAKSLTLTGTGDMFAYSSVESVPWSEYLPTLKTVTIGDDIRSIADYSFSGAKVLNKVTMPLSLKAPLLPETWKGCTAIKTIKLTYGTGYMDDYSDETDPNVYTYTPWYLSRNSITSFTLDPNVKYIGKQAFRNCLAIKALTLNAIECVAEDAFINCSKLKSVTITNKSGELTDYCFFFLKSAGNYMIYPTAVLRAYDDSTAHDYAVRMNTLYESLGCGHSRTIERKENEVPATCTAEGSYDAVVYCPDCDSEISRELVKTEAVGHSWDAGKVTRAATTAATGIRTYTCETCGATDLEEIPKLPPKNGWKKENGKWYYYTDNTAAKGWKKLDGKWYFFDKSNGAMKTGWLKDGGKWYYFNTSGAMVTGWQKISNAWYYFNGSGAMVTGWQKISNVWYYFNGSGAMVTGWQKITNKWYYFNGSGAMVTGWQKIGGSWYYFNSGGDMRTASLTQGGKTYYFNTSGACTNP